MLRFDDSAVRGRTPALSSKLPERTIKVIQSAKKYAEGTAVRIEVKAPGDLAAVRCICRSEGEELNCRYAWVYEPDLRRTHSSPSIA